MSCDTGRVNSRQLPFRTAWFVRSHFNFSLVASDLSAAPLAPIQEARLESAFVVGLPGTYREAIHVYTNLPVRGGTPSIAHRAHFLTAKDDCAPF
jgi:hypothetical protein